jgi:hypothetical protein
MFDHVGAEDWHLMWRAGVASKRASQRVEAESQSLTGFPYQVASKGCFLVDVSIIGRTLVVPIGLGTWHVRWFLDKTGSKTGRLYFCNGMTMVIWLAMGPILVNISRVPSANKSLNGANKSE